MKSKAKAFKNNIIQFPSQLMEKPEAEKKLFVNFSTIGYIAVLVLFPFFVLLLSIIAFVFFTSIYAIFFLFLMPIFVIFILARRVGRQVFLRDESPLSTLDPQNPQV